MKKGQETINILYLVLVMALFLILYVILIPEADKEAFINNPSELGTKPIIPTGGQGSGKFYQQSTREVLLLSETPGILYPYGQQLFVKPFASVNLFSTKKSGDLFIAPTLNIESNLFSGESKEFIFRLEDPRSIDTLRLLFVIQSAKGKAIISVNNKEIFNGKLTTSNLPLKIPSSYLQTTNKLTIEVPSGVLGSNAYLLKDIALFFSENVNNKRELRDFVLTRSQLQNLEELTLYYFVNCFTANEKGTLRIFLNGNLLSQQLVVCDAGEVGQDIPRQQLIEGRNVLEFTITEGKYILEQLALEGDAEKGRVPSYMFTLQIEDLRYRIPIILELTFFERDIRKVGTIFINGFPLYLDTYSDLTTMDISTYVVPGQNVIKLLPGTELDIIDLSVFLG